MNVSNMPCAEVKYENNVRVTTKITGLEHVMWSVSWVSEDYKLFATGLFCANENAIYMHALLTFMPNYFWHLVNFIFIAARRRQRGRGGAVSSRVRGRRSCDSQLRNTAPGIQPGKANCYTFFRLMLTVFVFTVKWSNRMKSPVPPPNEVKFLNFALSCPYVLHYYI